MLVKKWKRALVLYPNSEEAFTGLSLMADPGLVQKWKKGAEKVKRNWEKDVKAMDYFMVKGFSGKFRFPRPIFYEVILTAAPISSARLCGNSVGFNEKRS